MGKYMNIEEVLDEENGYLDEGALTVEYGLQANSVEDANGIWMFNCFDLFFDWQNQDNMFDFIIRHENSLFGHKQIITLHSKKISDSNKDWIRVPKSITDEYFVMCLQITHGVRPQLTVGELEIVLKTAFHFGFSNTVRYCEQQLIEMDEQIKVKLTRKIKLAVKFNMERYMKHLINQINSPERLMKILKRLNIEMMSSESMKTFFGKFIKFRIKFGAWVYPTISNELHSNIQIRVCFNILKNDGSSAFKVAHNNLYLKSDERCIGEYMHVEDLLDEKNGYLDEGALTVEYGFQVESEQRENGIRMFNFFDLFFDWQNQDNMFDFIIRHENPLFGHKQIVRFHSKKISDLHKDWVRVPKSIAVEQFCMCLQITHGVRLHLTAEELVRIIGIAFHFGFSNTVRYCEQQLIEMDGQTKMKLTRKIKLAVRFNMERYLNCLIKQIKSPERLMSILKRLNIEKMSSESMKTFVGKYLELIEF